MLQAHVTATAHATATAIEFEPDETVIAESFDRREDLEVQVKLTVGGEWHRKAVGGMATACGRPLGGYATRDEQYMGNMCKVGCFTHYELSLIPSSPNAPDRPEQK